MDVLNCMYELDFEHWDLCRVPKHWFDPERQFQSRIWLCSLQSQPFTDTACLGVFERKRGVGHVLSTWSIHTNPNIRLKETNTRIALDVSRHLVFPTVHPKCMHADQRINNSGLRKRIAAWHVRMTNPGFPTRALETQIPLETLVRLQEINY